MYIHTHIYDYASKEMHANKLPSSETIIKMYTKLSNHGKTWISREKKKKGNHLCLLFYFYLCYHPITLNVFHKLVIWPQHLTLL